ncbi:MAG TPA: shikimate dehydrogenase [Xanthomonadales bacterium]
MDQGKELIRLALFGQPVKTSLSPVIHRRFADQFKLAIDYQAIETGAADFPKALEAFRLAGGTGCNITLPLKQDAWRLAAQATEEVALARAANTLVYQPQSGWFAHTTDGAGLLADLCENHGIELSAKRILILGAGGATAGILGRLLDRKPGHIMLVNRNLERARELAGRFGSSARMSVSSWSDLPRQGAFDLVINATSLGHSGETPPLSASSFAAGSLCYDLNYFNASLPLKKRCEEIGQAYLDGLGMLVEQAAESFYIWTGKRPETAAVIDACRRDTG